MIDKSTLNFHSGSECWAPKTLFYNSLGCQSQGQSGRAGGQSERAGASPGVLTASLDVLGASPGVLGAYQTLDVLLDVLLVLDALLSALVDDSL